MIEDRTCEKGCYFLVQEALLLIDPNIFIVDVDVNFNMANGFSSNKNRIQGQLHQILCYLPNRMQDICTTDLISGAFTDGMSGQRSTISHQLHGQSLAKIVDDIKPFESSSSCFNAFAAFIGYPQGTNTVDLYYSKARCC
ncbi:hypothetical protein C8R44DRAFT_867161 [Mycena epipterygia]|nr:hypothetical protein C8R44DRAFT_867161 [Mycena epipterygia]